MLVRSQEELEAAKNAISAEYASLPHFSAFGGDNYGSRDLAMRTLERIEEGIDDLDEMIDEMYDGMEDEPELESGYEASVHLLYWAMGDEEEPL